MISIGLASTPWFVGGKLLYYQVTVITLLFSHSSVHGHRFSTIKADDSSNNVAKDFRSGYNYFSIILELEIVSDHLLVALFFPSLCKIMDTEILRPCSSKHKILLKMKNCQIVKTYHFKNALLLFNLILS